MKFDLTPKGTQYISGFGTVIYAPSALNPLGCMQVHCEKHDVWIPVDFSLLDDGFVRGDKILEAFKNCSGCKEAEVWKETRFPEGAEL